MAADSFRDERKAQFVNRKPITILLYKKTSTVSILTAVSGETMLVLYQIREEPKEKHPVYNTQGAGLPAYIFILNRTYVRDMSFL